MFSSNIDRAMPACWTAAQARILRSGRHGRRRYDTYRTVIDGLLQEALERHWDALTALAPSGVVRGSRARTQTACS